MQGKTGLWIAGICAVVILISVGYGLGRKANNSASSNLTPAGAPLPPIQIEPIQPHEELAAITSSTSGTTTGPKSTTSGTSTPSMGAESFPTESLSGTPAATAAAKTAPPVNMKNLDGSRIKEVQQALKLAGFDPGPVDGRMGARTRTALRDFQLANGLEADGKVGPRTWNKLETYVDSASTSTTTNTNSPSN